MGATRIKQLLATNGGDWHVVTHNRETKEGSLYHRVACWAVVSEPTGDRVVAMIGDIDGQAALDFYRFDHPDVLGIAEPGEEKGTWDDIANQLLEHEREADAIKENEQVAPRIAGMLASTDETALRAMLAGDKGLVPSDTNLIELAELGLITLWKPSSGDPRHAWVITALGRVVCAELDKRLR